MNDEEYQIGSTTETVSPISAENEAVVIDDGPIADTHYSEEPAETADGCSVKKYKRIFFVDFENGDSADRIEGIDHMRVDDCVRLYFREAVSPKLSIDQVEMMLHSFADIVFVKSPLVAKQAVDIQILLEMYRAVFEEGNEDAEFIIVSLDKGYDEDIKNLKSKNKTALRTESIKAMTMFESRIRSYFGQKLKNEYSDKREDIIHLLKKGLESHPDGKVAEDEIRKCFEEKVRPLLDRR